MTAHRAIQIAIASVAIVGILLGAVSPAAASCLWQTGPLPKGSVFAIPSSIRAFSPNDIWVAENADRVAIHWDGTAWSSVTIPVNTPPGSITSVLAVTGTSDSDLWFDGLVRSNTDQFSKALHFDGSHWTTARLPSGYSPDQICLDEGPLMDSMQEFAPDDVWSVGEVCHIENGQDIVDAISEHWNGTRWKILPMADPTHFEPFGSPSQMSGTSDHDIWAVGAQSAIEHFDGTNWSISTPFGHSNPKLEGVFAGTTSDAWVVGFVGINSRDANGPQARTFAAHWNGRAWRRVPTPNDDGRNGERNNLLASVTGAAPNDVWAVGESDRPTGPTNDNARLEALHWNGTEWSNSSDDQLGFGGFFAVADLGPHDVWAVGLDNPNSGPDNPLASFRCPGN